MDKMEDERPEDDKDPFDDHIEDVMEANKQLREKVGLISEFVGKAITKASVLRR